MKCEKDKTCRHYSGGIYCIECKHLPDRPDNYAPIEPKEIPKEPHYNKNGRV